MKKLSVILSFILCAVFVCAQNTKDIQLKNPQKKGGAKIMQALMSGRKRRSLTLLLRSR